MGALDASAMVAQGMGLVPVANKELMFSGYCTCYICLLTTSPSPHLPLSPPPPLPTSPSPHLPLSPTPLPPHLPLSPPPPLPYPPPSLRVCVVSMSLTRWTSTTRRPSTRLWNNRLSPSPRRASRRHSTHTHQSLLQPTPLEDAMIEPSHSR